MRKKHWLVAHFLNILNSSFKEISEILKLLQPLFNPFIFIGRLLNKESYKVLDHLSNNNQSLCLVVNLYVYHIYIYLHMIGQETEDGCVIRK